MAAVLKRTGTGASLYDGIFLEIMGVENLFEELEEDKLAATATSLDSFLFSLSMRPFDIQ